MTYSVWCQITSNGGATVYALGIPVGNDVKGDVAAAYGLADPLTITQKLTDGPQGILAHPEPAEATLTIIAPDSSTYSGISLGDPIVIAVYPVSQYLGTATTFWGRVAAVQGDPHPLGVKLTIACVDYTADLAEIQVGGAVAYPQETAANRLARIAAEAGLPGGLPWQGGGLGGVTTPGGVQIAARSASWTDAYSLIRETLDAATVRAWRDPITGALLPAGSPAHSTSYRAYIVPNLAANLLDPAQPFSLRVGGVWSRRVQYFPPARLVNVAGVYGVQVSAADSSPGSGAPILSASRVEFAPTFAQTKGGGLPNVTIGQDAQGNRYVWDWRIQDGWATGGGSLVGGVLTPYSVGIPSGGGPALIQELDTVVDQLEGGGTPSQSTIGVVMDYRVPFRPSTLTDWAVGTMTWQCWAEPTYVISWTGTAHASTSELRKQDGSLETNLFMDPFGNGASATVGWVLNSGTLAKDAANAYRSPPPASRPSSIPLKVTTTVDNWGYLPTDGSGSSPSLSALTVGKTYTFRCVVKSDTAQTVVAKQYGANPATGASVALTPGVWAPVTVTWTQGATGFLSVRRADGTPLVGTLWLAAWMVKEGTSITLSPSGSGVPFWAPGDPTDIVWLRPDLTQLVTVAGAAAGKLPNDREWLAGLVTGTQLRVERGRPTLDLDVAPVSLDYVANREQLGSSLGVASMDSPVLSGVTLAQLKARDTLADYMIVRGS